MHSTPEQTPPKQANDGALPQGFKKILGVLLLIIAVGFTAIWGVFA